MENCYRKLIEPLNNIALNKCSSASSAYFPLLSGVDWADDSPPQSTKTNVIYIMNPISMYTVQCSLSTGMLTSVKAR